MADAEIKCGDNLGALGQIESESVDLVYLDPPYNTGIDRGEYTDNWKTTDDFVEFMEPRLREIHRVLKPSGSLYLQADHNSDSYLRVLLDGIFGRENLRSKIRWKRAQAKNNVKNHFPNNSDTILYYSKGKNYTFNQQFKPLSEKHIKSKYIHDDKDGKGKYYKSPVDAPSGRQFSLGLGERTPSRGYGPSKEKLLQLYDEGLLVVEKGKLPYKKIYLKDAKGVPFDNTWDDINFVRKASGESVGYPTQKPEALLERVIKTSSNEGDVVLDAFAGSGTTCAVAKMLGRDSICIDQNENACQIMEERLQ